MNLDAFQDLLLRHLESPDDVRLRREFEAALEAHPQWLDHWRVLRDQYQLSRAAGPVVAELLEPAPTTTAAAAVPWDRLSPAATTATATAPARGTTARWRTAASLAFAASLALMLVWRPWREAGPSVDALAAAAPRSLALALVAPASDLLAAARLPTQRAGPALVHIRQPITAAAAGPVAIEWSPATTAVVTLRRLDQVVWRADDVTPPQTTPTLPTGGVYVLEVMPRDGSPAVVTRFVTVTGTASTPADPLAAIVALCAEEPARLGEAVARWWALPADLRETDAGARLGIWLALEANQPDLLATARDLLGH